MLYQALPSYLDFSGEYTVFDLQAIDLIDEAGSRVRLQHAQLPEEARDLDKEYRAILKEKDALVRAQDFESAAKVRSVTQCCK